MKRKSEKLRHHEPCPPVATANDAVYITYHASRTTHHEIRNKLDEAHKMLSEVYHWFTKGFNTKDLQEAKALIDELDH